MKDAIKTQVSFEIEVPQEDWIDYLTKHNDIFMSSYCGYWLHGVSHRDDKWLVVEDDERSPERDAAEHKRFAAGMVPSPPYMVIDKDMAIKAYTEGVKKWGLDWMDSEHGDANGYDVVIQLALLGEVRYG